MVISDIESREQLAFLLNIPLSKLTYLLYVKKIDNCYTSFDIKKKNNGVRVISAPNEDLKDIQRKLGTSVSVRKKTWMAMIAPIQYDNQITGAICLFRSWQTIQKDQGYPGRYAAAWICGADQI